MSQHASVLTIDGVRSTGPPGPKSRGTQTREPVSIECALPITELFLGQLIAAASLKRDSAIAQRRYNRGLTARHPSLGIWRRQISHRPSNPSLALGALWAGSNSY